MPLTITAGGISTDYDLKAVDRDGIPDFELAPIGDLVDWRTARRAVRAASLDGDGRPHGTLQLVIEGLASRGGGRFPWLLKRMG